MTDQRILSDATLEAMLARRAGPGAPTGLTASIAAQVDALPETHRRWWSALVPPAGQGPALRLVWIVALVGLLLAASVSALYVGSELSRRANELTDVRLPTLTLAIPAHPEGVSAIAWSPDGAHLATASRAIERRSGTARTWDAATGDALLSFATGSWETTSVEMVYSPDGRHLALGGPANAVYDATTGAEFLGEIGDRPLAYSPDGTRLAAGGAWGWAAILNAHTGEIHVELPLSPSWVWDAAWSPDGTRLATTWGTSTKVWDATTGEERLTLEGTVTVTDLAWSPDGARIAAASDGGIIEIWDAASGAKLTTLTPSPWVDSLAWSPDFTRLATTHHDGTARIRDAASGMELAILPGHTGVVTDVAWSPDGARIATAGQDGTAKVWLLQSEASPPLVQTTSPTATPSPVPSPTLAPVQVGAFQVVASDGYWGEGWGRSRASVAEMLTAIALRGDYQAADDPCTEPVIPDLPDPGVHGLETLETDGPAQGTGLSRLEPNGVAVTYRADEAVLHEAFVRIVEQIERCVADVPFREQGLDGMIRVQRMQIATLGDEQVAVKVSDVGPDSSGPGWTASYYWIGFAREGDLLVGVTLNEAWRGHNAGSWLDEYPQPTILDGELAIQLSAALATGTSERPGGD